MHVYQSYFEKLLVTELCSGMSSNEMLFSLRRNKTSSIKQQAALLSGSNVVPRARYDELVQPMKADFDILLEQGDATAVMVQKAINLLVSPGGTFLTEHPFTDRSALYRIPLELVKNRKLHNEMLSF